MWLDWLVWYADLANMGICVAFCSKMCYFFAWEG